MNTEATNKKMLSSQKTAISAPVLQSMGQMTQLSVHTQASPTQVPFVNAVVSPPGLKEPEPFDSDIEYAGTSPSSASLTPQVSRKKRRPFSAPSKKKQKGLKSRNEKTNKCIFCHSATCHEDLYGDYCTREASLYMLNTLSRRRTAQGMYEMYQATYTSAVKWDLFRAYGTAVERRGLFALPICMLNGSYTKCTNYFNEKYGGGVK